MDRAYTTTKTEKGFFMTACIQQVRMIGLTAFHGAGKGEVAKYLSSKGFRHFSVRHDVLWPEVDRQGLPRDRDSLNRVGNQLRQEHGADYVTRVLVDKALESGVNTVVESFYTLSEIHHARQESRALGVKFTLMAVDADREIRYSRICKRASETDNLSFAEFCEKELRESSSLDPKQHNLRACRDIADIVVLNQDSIEHFHRQLETRLAMIDIIV